MISQEINSSHKIQIEQFPKFWRCTIRNEYGQPIGLGEDETEAEAIRKAQESYRKDSQCLIDKDLKEIRLSEWAR